MQLKNRLTYILASGLLILMFCLTFFSMKNDSLTFDELAHLPAGYSYLTQKDMRLNPEHPPLIKDLSGLLLLPMSINFPVNSPNWQNGTQGNWWVQFDFGSEFLYRSGNDTDKIILFGRIPMIFVLILLGFYVFKWARELFGNKAGLLALFLYSFSPTFLAHGRLVTTDVGAATGIFIASYYFIKALQNNSWRNILFAGIAFGLALLTKFTTILLVPFFIFLALIWWLTKSGNFKSTLKILIFSFLIGIILVGAVYQYHVANYPAEKQAKEAYLLLKTNPFHFLSPIVVKMTEFPVLRAYSQYLLGLSMVFERASYGHTTYFMGEVSSSGWKSYFPIVYLVKETLVFHILTLIALIFALLGIRKSSWKNISNGIKNNFTVFAMISFVILYWAFSLKSNLNLGVRHLLVIFPLMFILVSGGIIKLFNNGQHSKLKYNLLIILLIWQAVSVIKSYPSFLSYFNGIAGGSDNGYKVTVDSNFDWGQNLKRLADWTDQNNVKKIYVDYFGGGDPKYYLKQKYAQWTGTNYADAFPKGNYLAVSGSSVAFGQGKPSKDLSSETETGFYLWLNNYKPVAKIGESIFVYYIE